MIQEGSRIQRATAFGDSFIDDLASGHLMDC